MVWPRTSLQIVPLGSHLTETSAQLLLIFFFLRIKSSFKPCHYLRQWTSCVFSNFSNLPFLLGHHLLWSNTSLERGGSIKSPSVESHAWLTLRAQSVIRPAPLAFGGSFLDHQERCLSPEEEVALVSRVEDSWAAIPWGFLWHSASGTFSSPLFWFADFLWEVLWWFWALFLCSSSSTSYIAVACLCLSPTETFM